jgi:hypothetical protein
VWLFEGPVCTTNCRWYSFKNKEREEEVVADGTEENEGDGNLKSRQASPGEDPRKGVDPGGYREGRSQT